MVVNQAAMYVAPVKFGMYVAYHVYLVVDNLIKVDGWSFLINF